MCIHDYICMYTYVWVSLYWSNFDLGVPLDDPPWALVCTSPTPAQVCCHLDQQQTLRVKQKKCGIYGNIIYNL